jgi:hypothetical protein
VIRALLALFRPRQHRYVFEHRKPSGNRVLIDAPSEDAAWKQLLGTDDPVARELSEWWLAEVQRVPGT